MDLFNSALTIRLTSYKDKYLKAGEDEESVFQEHDGSTKNAIWKVEFVQGRDVLRLKSCCGKYLTATNIPFLPKVTAKKVQQILLSTTLLMDPRTEWQPIRDGFQVKLKSLSGNYLRPNGGLPPWNDSVIHDVPHWNTSKPKILWDVEIVEKCVDQCRRTQSAMKTYSRATSASGSFRMSIAKANSVKTHEYI